jgi:hypothetical protein
MLDFFEHIDDYVQGKLNAKDKLTFENELKENELLKAAVENYDLAKEISLGFLEAYIRGVLSDTKPIAKSPKKPNYKWIWVVIAALLLTIVGYFVLDSNIKPQKINYADIYKAPTWPMDRSDDGNQLAAAINTALGGDLSSGIMMLKQSELPHTEKQLWIAELFAFDLQSDSTLLYLPLQSSDNVKRDRVNYLRIISHYQLDEMQKVKQRIAALPSDTDKWYMDIYAEMN